MLKKNDPFWDDGCALYLQSLFYFVWDVSVSDKKKIFAEAGLKWEPVYDTQTLNQITKLTQLEVKKYHLALRMKKSPQNYLY